MNQEKYYYVSLLSCLVPKIPINNIEVTINFTQFVPSWPFHPFFIRLPDPIATCSDRINADADGLMEDQR